MFKIKMDRWKTYLDFPLDELAGNINKAVIKQEKLKKSKKEAVDKDSLIKINMNSTLEMENNENGSLFDMNEEPSVEVFNRLNNS